MTTCTMKTVASTTAIKNLDACYCAQGLGDHNIHCSCCHKGLWSVNGRNHFIETSWGGHFTGKVCSQLKCQLYADKLDAKLGIPDSESARRQANEKELIALRAEV